MTTFQMAQMAFENPGMKFRCDRGDAGWDKSQGTVRWLDGSGDLNLFFWQRKGVEWEPVQEPRTWRGEYTIAEWRATGITPWDDVPAQCKAVVTWEAKEVLP